jgi:hypothetical protein
MAAAAAPPSPPPGGAPAAPPSSPPPGPVATASVAVARLLESYASAVLDADERDLSLALFKTQWKAAKFSELHYKCPAGSDQADYLQCLFAAALGARACTWTAPPPRARARARRARLPLAQLPPHVSHGYPAAAVYISDTYEIYKRVGCAFLLYCLHGSQPRQPPLPIRLVQSLWDPMVQLRQDVRRQSSDGFAVLQLMHDQGILEYCAVATTGLGASVADAAAMQASRQYSDIRAIRRKPLDLACADCVNVAALTADMAAYRDAKAAAAAQLQSEGGSRASSGLGAARLLTRLGYVDMEWDKKVAKILADYKRKLETGPPAPAPAATTAAATAAAADSSGGSWQAGRAGGGGSRGPSRGRKRPAAAVTVRPSAPSEPQQVDEEDEEEEFADMSSLLGSSASAM